MKQKPDAEEFSRILLSHVCGLRADLRVMMQMFARSIEPDSAEADKIYAKWIEQALETQKKLYEAALDRVGIRPEEDQR